MSHKLTVYMRNGQVLECLGQVRTCVLTKHLPAPGPLTTSGKRTLQNHSLFYSYRTNATRPCHECPEPPNCESWTNPSLPLSHRRAHTQSKHVDCIWVCVPRSHTHKQTHTIWSSGNLLHHLIASFFSSIPLRSHNDQISLSLKYNFGTLYPTQGLPAPSQPARHRIS